MIPSSNDNQTMAATPIAAAHGPRVAIVGGIDFVLLG
jgi:hypothetical protein